MSKGLSFLVLSVNFIKQELKTNLIVLGFIEY